MTTRPIDRRDRSRTALFLTRRRYPRLAMTADVFYESDEATVFASEVDVSLRGLFVPCRFPDREGAEGVVRIDLGEGALAKARVEVLKVQDGEKSGMALRIVSMPEADRLRFAAFLLRKGGLTMLPQLDRRFHTVATAPRPLEALRSAAA
ncbi:MAG: PilZ domain-containing protein [Deltaproteobacteria bacterium]|nr:PilZ domain-containing protein [Deltaproteobacteria bacterium]